MVLKVLRIEDVMIEIIVKIEDPYLGPKLRGKQRSFRYCLRPWTILDHSSVGQFGLLMMRAGPGGKEKREKGIKAGLVKQ